MSKPLLYISLLTCAALFHLEGSAQFYFYNNHYYEYPLTWEAGVFAGGMNCLTDLGGKSGKGSKFIKDINWTSTQLCQGVYAAASYGNLLGIKLELTFGGVAGADSVLKADKTVARNRYNRNLSFRSDITELSLVAELYPLSLLAKEEGGSALSPYVFGGIALFTFNPQARLSNSWVSLQPLHTEGQGFAEYPGRAAYKLTQANMPLGIGIKYEVSALLNIRVEGTYRKLWTDYLDDVSQSYINPELFSKHLSPQAAQLARQLADRQVELNPSHNTSPGDIRGNKNGNDTYFSFQLKAGLVLGRQRR